MSKIKILELFGGIGACTKALKRLGFDTEVVDYVEIDKYAVKSYNAINETNFEPQDITMWDKNIDVDLISHGSPCQDFSLAGKQAGGDIGSGTRSSLMYETIRIVGKLRPKYVIWENVKNLLSKKHRHNFDAYLQTMEALGYKNYYQVLNAKDYEIPQNRERVFTISIRNDIDKDFVFPPKQELKLKLKDMLEDEVDEKYYLTNKMIKYISADNEKWSGNNGKALINKDIATTINTGEGSRRCDASNYVSYPYTSIINIKCNCLNFVDRQSVKQNLKIRKLTPKECWRLMGFDDEDFEKAEKVNSNTQLYKQAGNSIVVNVLESIFKKLLMKGEE